ncbi:MAG: DUF1992 domain-containing protein [Chloroflexi bacterium]|nr:DUF1992 domain-containing protein [Chloroflexota bacterium]
MTDKWGKLVEERLQTAFAEGKFADLPGKGKPLNLEEDPLADPALWMARHILRNSGMSLPWVEERRRIEKLCAEAAAELARSWSMYGACESAGHPGAAAEARWQKAMADYRERVSALNKRIRTYNLSVPHVRFQRRLIEAEREIARVRRQKA